MPSKKITPVKTARKPVEIPEFALMPVDQRDPLACGALAARPSTLN
jgi:hypothetical protein